MSGDSPKKILLSEYTEPNYWIESVDLYFDLNPDKTMVRATMDMVHNPNVIMGDRLVLDGKDLELRSIKVDGAPLSSEQYEATPSNLTLFGMPDSFTLETEVIIQPEKNTALEGLYSSNGMYCTQCEAQGFRRITYYLDRPDVMAKFSTTIEANAADFPVMLSNGNPVQRDDLNNGRHRIKWVDPFKKPAYLFALVAGDLECIEDSYQTRSGRDVSLQIFVEKQNADKCAHAMQALIDSMRWDETRFDLEYDLDIYMIVAVDHFNAGAMENKGLNIFNSKYVLARQETATDRDFHGIQGVIGHEYFHNWTGNRVTCREWFQLSLKEGLTVFRDQEFSGDLNSAPVERIRNVNMLRAHQFAEDAGPMSHPVRPASYIEINNFYTATVYNKGAEVIRMVHTLLGEDGFQKGMRLYFERFDGQAVTCEDFIGAMSDANHFDFDQFFNWYVQAGTPHLDISVDYDSETRTADLKVRQSCRVAPGEALKKPFFIPLRMSLWAQDGTPIPLEQEVNGDAPLERVLVVRDEEATFTFYNVPSAPTPSLLRNFSAPVTLNYRYRDDELAFLLAKDTDPFSAWEAGQRLSLGVLLKMVESIQAGNQPKVPDIIIAAFGQCLANSTLDRALLAESLTLPSEMYVGAQMEVIDPGAIHEARKTLKTVLGKTHHDAFLRLYHANQSDEPYAPNAEQMGIRSLKNVALGYLVATETEDALDLAKKQYDESDNMTDGLAALGALAGTSSKHRQPALTAFYETWKHDPLVIDKWFSIQAMSGQPNTLKIVKELTAHSDFELSRPNRVNALLGAFGYGNQAFFHHESGEGYALLKDYILKLDALNPQIAARMARVFGTWRRFDEHRQQHARRCLEEILETDGLSKHTYEIISTTLG